MATPIEEALVLKPTLPTTIVFDIADIAEPTADPDYVYQVAYIWDIYTNSYGIWIATPPDEGSTPVWRFREGRRAGFASQTTFDPLGRGEVYFNLTNQTIHQSIDGFNWIQIG
jgi:hypothetical protein